MKPVAEIPSWLSITRVDDRHYQLTDISVASIGCCLGIFHCREAAESIARKIAVARVFKPASSTVRGTSAAQDAFAIGTALGRKAGYEGALQQ